MINVQLADGTDIVLRPVRPEDKPLLVAGMARLSDRSRRQRFLVATEHLTRAQLAYLTEVDQRDHHAWGVLSNGEPVAIGRLVRLDDDEGEVAITVLDDWQGRGIGEILIQHLAGLAREAGIKRLIFVSLPENVGIARLLARFENISKTEDGLVTTTIETAMVAPPSFAAGFR
ncbi:MAG TPA: GNAT family N-acetyltransferase [Acidimicrobiia bacterium]|nr:GNAT family N-acetyltransferase [Acidimicrobiia bacterium]